MCEFCSGSTHKDIQVPAGETKDAARQALSRDADLGAPFVGNVDVAQADKAKEKDAPSDKPADPLEVLKDKYGVEVREVGGQHEFYFRADGVDHVVLKTAADADSLKQAPAQLDKIVEERVKSIEKEFKVRFAKPGEEIGHERLEGPNCERAKGPMVHAIQPQLTGLYAVEAGLKVSQPSQFNEDRKTGLKIYFQDRQYIPDTYGGKKVLGVYVSEDKNGEPAFMLSPAGQKLAPTAKDMKPGEVRNLAWAVAHEVTHNSQMINWGQFPPPAITNEMGWDKTDFSTLWGWGPKYAESYRLRGKDGELYANGTDSCKNPSTWFRIDGERYALDKDGKRVGKIKDAQHFTNEEVMDRSQVRPITYYFMNPREMHSEALTSYRMGREDRENLYKQSPVLYKVAQEYDQKELNKFYGQDWRTGAPKKVRSPDGFVVDRTPMALKIIEDYESQIKSSTAAKK